MQNCQKGSLPLILIIFIPIVLGLSVGGFLYVNNQSKRSAISQTSPFPTVTPSSAAIPTTSPFPTYEPTTIISFASLPPKPNFMPVPTPPPPPPPPPPPSQELLNNIPKDTDFDEVFDKEDNCPNHINTDQVDDDKNGVGNACEPQSAEYMTSLAKKDLAYFHNIPLEEITTKSAVEVTWKDPCLELIHKTTKYENPSKDDPCYKITNTPGYKIVFTSKDKDYEVRTDKVILFILNDPTQYDLRKH